MSPLGKQVHKVSSTECIDPMYKWRLNLNNNTWYILSLTFMFQDMNARLRMYEYSYLNLGATYAKSIGCCKYGSTIFFFLLNQVNENGFYKSCIVAMRLTA